MKKILIVAVLLLLGTNAWAGWNFNFFGSNDKQKKSRQQYSQTNRPNDPMPVPEPGTMMLLATGFTALGGMEIIRRRKNKK